MFGRNGSHHWYSGPTLFIHINRSSCRYCQPPPRILNCSDGKLVDEMTHQFIQGGRVTAQIQSMTVNDHTNLPKVHSLLQEFPKLTRPRTEQPLVPNTKVTHVIDTGDSAPTYAKVRNTN